MQLPFAKYHGAGNDFVIFDDRNLKFPTEDQKFIEHLCEHRLGVGADGVVVLQLSEKADFRMRIFNADGKEAAQCGNGLRCLVDFIRRKYTNDLKNREFDKKGPQNFCSERATIAERLRTPTNSPVDCLSGKQVNEENRPEGGASENKNSEAAESKKRSEGPFSRGAGERSELARRDPTQSKTDSSSCLGIHL
ncbi:MAG TPA: hypothetical protein VFU89_06465, partial [Rhabdochlamydiaceae bacterium]|nr:hypothetical protein [Rhabdochlamydiaceae bacterium]